MARIIILGSALFSILMATSPALAADRDDFDVQLVAALEAYRDHPVKLDPSEFAAPELDRSSARFLDDFGPQAGGHTLRQTYEAFRKNEARIAEKPGGYNVWIYEENMATWNRIFLAIMKRVDRSIRQRYDAGDPLFHDFYTIRNYQDLKRLGEQAQARLGYLSRGELGELRAAKAQQGREIERSVRPVRGSFAGTWKTSWGGGGAAMTLSVSGRTVTGTYEYRNGRVEGTLSADGRTIEGTWYQGDGRRNGKFRFVLSEDGRSFSGTYGYGGKLGSAPWSGKRQGS